jgi:MarR family transcriptional regulator, organic hydroperoxide resistance regulator
MTERATREEHIAAIDRMIDEVTWQAQKQAIQTLMGPEIDLTMPQMVTLLVIREHGACRMGTLVEATRQSGGTVTGIVDRLIQDGLVERAHAADDRRAVEVRLTAAGEERARRVIVARHEDMCRILARFGDGQLAEFAHLLRLFIQALHDDLAGGDQKAVGG